MEIQIIVNKNLVIIGDTSVSIDCSKFKEQFVFCEVNEKEKWIEKVPFNGKEQPEDWIEIDEFIDTAKLKSNQPNSYSVWNGNEWVEDEILKNEFVILGKKAEKELKQAEKAAAQREKAKNNIEKAKSKINNNKKDLEKDKEKFEKLRRKGKLSTEDELKWREKILKKENKALELQLDLEKAQNKLDKLD